jgi:hypothetical protein
VQNGSLAVRKMPSIVCGGRLSVYGNTAGDLKIAATVIGPSEQRLALSCTIPRVLLRQLHTVSPDRFLHAGTGRHKITAVQTQTLIHRASAFMTIHR